MNLHGPKSKRYMVMYKTVLYYYENYIGDILWTYLGFGRV